MGSYQVRLGQLLTAEGDSGDGRTIGLDDYPIPDYWTEDDRTALNKKIIGHYFMREIGQETSGIFIHFLRQQMWEIMPAYVQLYETTRLTFDPIVSVKLDTARADDATEHAQRDSQSNSTNASNSGGRTTTSDLPNTMLQGDEDYASSAVDSQSATTGTGATTGTDSADTTNSNKGTSSTTGYQGSPSDLLQKYRSTILNIDRMIISDLADNFMLLLSNMTEMRPEIGYYA